MDCSYIMHTYNVHGCNSIYKTSTFMINMYIQGALQVFDNLNN